MAEISVDRELCCVATMIRREIDSFSDKRELDRVTGTNGWIIGYLAGNEGKDIFQRDIEKDFSITRSTASKVIDLMVKKGLIERSAVSYDARLKKLSLTPKAWMLHTKMEQCGRKVHDMAMRGFSEEEEAALHEYLRRIRENMSK